MLLLCWNHIGLHIRSSSQIFRVRELLRDSQLGSDASNLHLYLG